ncbi:MAG: HD domain-containing protein [bacterium]|nr:HD domain-containing protein [bacterium]MDZ4285411.1 HD domain-containing protein [Candidatus Sungbacteria bacterium]
MKTISIADAIYGTIVLSEGEAAIVDHSYVQRLRFIRQLGFVSFVYPCATHDRFSHALGAMHVSSLFADQLLTNDEYSVLARILNAEEKKFLRRIIRLSGLLHDVGHAPFSHTAEAVMPPLSDLAIPDAWLRHPLKNRAARHEDYSVLLIAGMSEGNDAVITKEEAEIISSLIHHKYIRIPDSWHTHFSERVNSQSLHGVIKTIISSDIDADRMDYLLRDAHFAGVTYGHFDLPWLISNLGTVRLDNAYSISISESGIQALEHYLLARANMYAQVYMHKTVKCFDYYFHKAIEEKEIGYHMPIGREAYVAMRDSTLIELLFGAAKQNPLSWSARLMNRQPAKRLCRIWGSREQAEILFGHVYKELQRMGIHPFLHFTKNKFLDVESSQASAASHSPQSLFSGLATVPVTVVRKQFGIISAAPLSDYAFILKRYHDDIAVGDIYILRDDYEANVSVIRSVIKKFHVRSPTEIIISEED